ncbi:MAG: ferrous iron transport protein B, partial [Clostridiales bacterium]|nr:ferrous iron transport protein B [Clostridiales bacterium]
VNEVGLDREAALADMRYTFIEGLCSRTVTKGAQSKEHIRSIKIDNLITHKYLGIPIFLCVMLAIFWVTFGAVGSFLSDLLNSGIDALTQLVSTGLTSYGINPVVHSLVIDGVFAGVGSVLSFLPMIVVLFFFLSILEDTGYMARVAFVMDKLLRKIGLSGKSFVPMLIGFGCSVPAIMSSRTLSSNRDRKMTILLTPFMSCSAKVPIYAMFASTFFPKHEALVMIGLYVLGILMAIVCGLVFKGTLFRGKPIPFVMELPNYRIPTLKSVLLLMWEKAKDFIVKAFTIIFAATVLIWFLRTFDLKLNVVENASDSILAVIGSLISPIFAPLGFGDWRISTALITGFSAKEAVISTLAVLTGTSLSDLSGTLGAFFTTATAISFLVFTLLYTPCVAAVAAVKRELGSKLQAACVMVFQTSLAWIAAFVVYNIVKLI